MKMPYKNEDEFVLGQKIKIVLIVVMLILAFLAGCAKSNNSDKQKSYPEFTPVAEGKYGFVSKYKDGDNIIYIYERSGGGSAIAVTK